MNKLGYFALRLLVAGGLWWLAAYFGWLAAVVGLAIATASYLCADWDAREHARELTRILRKGE